MFGRALCIVIIFSQLARGSHGIDLSSTSLSIPAGPPAHDTAAPVMSFSNFSYPPRAVGHHQRRLSDLSSTTISSSSTSLATSTKPTEFPTVAPSYIAHTVFSLTLTYQTNGIALPISTAGREVLAQATALALQVTASKVQFLSSNRTTDVSPAFHLRGSETNVSIQLAVALTVDDLVDSTFGDEIDEIAYKVDRLRANISNGQFVPMVQDFASIYSVPSEFANVTIYSVESSAVTTTSPAQAESSKKNPMSRYYYIAALWLVVSVGVSLCYFCASCCFEAAVTARRSTAHFRRGIVRDPLPPARLERAAMTNRAINYTVVNADHQCELGSLDADGGVPCACSVCEEVLDSGEHRGAKCANGHVICWNGCFGPLLNAAQDGTNVSEEGTLRCPICKDPYSLARIAQFAPTIFSDHVIVLKVKVLSDKQVRAANNELDAQRLEELMRIREMSPEDQQVFHLKKVVVEDILILHCPNPDCRAPFDDFTACFAITCTQCNVKFCAWCFHRTIGASDEIHAHVRQCPQTRGPKGNTFGDRALLNQAWNELRIQRLQALTDGSSDEVKSKLLQELQVELKGRGIHLNKL